MGFFGRNPRLVWAADRMNASAYITLIVVHYIKVYDIMLNYFTSQNIIPRLNSSLGAKPYQWTATLNSICPQSYVKDHPTTFRVTCGQHVEPPADFGFLAERTATN